MMVSYIFSIYHGWLGYIPEKKKQGIDNMEFHPGVAIEEIACGISSFWILALRFPPMGLL